MAEIRTIRINKVLRELNISLEKAILFFKENKINVEANPNAKISEFEYEILKKEFDIKKPVGIIVLESEFEIKLRLKNNKTHFKNENNFYSIDENGDVVELNIKLPEFIFEGGTFNDKVKKQKNFFKLISQFQNIQILELPYNDFEDFEILNGFSDLKHLNLRNSGISDISFLKNMHSLTFLDLQENAISDISFLKDLVNLRFLNLANNHIMDISPLKGLVNIENLSLNNNQLENISVLRQLKSILSLDLSSNCINNINALSGFKIFDFLNLSDNQIVDIFPLKGIEIRIDLLLGNNQIIDLTPIYHSLREDKLHLVSIFDAHENPLEYPPSVIATLGEAEIRSWFEGNLEIARYKIDLSKNEKRKILDLGNCGLTDLSLLPELFNDNEHLEELILSNHYATFDDQGNWNKNERDGYYPNNISIIPNGIKNLKNLKKLFIGGDWKKGNKWNRWRIRSISNLCNLNNLEILNISNNLITQIPDLTNLVNLRTLYANNNNIKKIASLGKFESLQDLYLSNNELTSVDFLKELISIRTIDLHSNGIKDLKPIINIINLKGINYSRWKVDSISLGDNPLDDTLINILNINNSTDKEIELKNYFERLLQGDSIIVRRVKLILLGNTRAGKTTLADILAKTNEANGDSTHGVNFFKFKVKDIEVSGYDFGGQDYYHNTHHSFFDEKSLYLLVWGNGQENSLALNDDREILFPINYWLGSLNKYAYRLSLLKFFENIKNLSKLNLIVKDDISNLVHLLDLKSLELNDNNNNEDIFNKLLTDLDNSVEDYVDYFINASKLNYSKIRRRFNETNVVLDPPTPTNKSIYNDFSFQTFVIQNVKRNDSKKRLNELDLGEKYNFINDFRSFNFKFDNDKISNFIDLISSAFVKETRVLNIDNNVSKAFDTYKNQVLLSVDEVKKLEEKIKNYDKNEIDSLLKSLHGILSCYYFKMTNELREKLSNNKLNDIVIIDIERFTEWIYQILNQQEFLKEKEGYFSKKDAEKWLDDKHAKSKIDYLLAFMIQNKLIFKMKNQEQFFSPNYLKDEQTQTEKLFLNSFSKPLVKYVFNEYFHTSILSEIINEYFDHLIEENDKNRWKFVLWKNKLVFYEDDNVEKLVYISFEIKQTQPTILISRHNLVSDKFILEISKFIESIIKCYDYQKIVLSKNGNYLPYDILENVNETEDNQKSNIIIFENKIYKRSDFKMFLNDKEKYPMKKVCISYSKEDLKLVHKFKDYLVPLSDDGLIEDPWYCTDLIAGEAWDEKIKSKFEEADIIFFMISENLLKTRYVKDIEIKNAIDRWNKDRSVKIIPIILEYYHWTRDGDYNLGKFTALPYLAKPILDFKRPKMAWYTVIEAIKVMLKNDLHSGSAELNKEVKKIYERMIDGKVDDGSQ